MKIVELKEKELNEVNIIIKKYKEIESELFQVQIELEKLDQEKDRLLKKLEKTRQQERHFSEKLNSSYGKGQIDLYTMKYVINYDN